MGFKKSWEVGDIAGSIRNISHQTNSSYNDGFIQWGCKQDLYILKEIIDRELEVAPHFGAMEDEWLKLREQERILNILKQR